MVEQRGIGQSHGNLPGLIHNIDKEHYIMCSHLSGAIKDMLSHPTRQDVFFLFNGTLEGKKLVTKILILQLEQIKIHVHNTIPT